jgi:hypothetical protein
VCNLPPKYIELLETVSAFGILNSKLSLSENY